MRLKSTAFGFVLVLIALGAITSLPASAQTPSVFSFTLEGSSLALCWFYGVSFSVTQGQQLMVQWGENSTGLGPVSLDVYIARLGSINQRWFCDSGPGYLYWNEGAFGLANWSAPSTGAYVVLLVNYSYHSVSGIISVAAANVTLSATPIGPGTVRRLMCLSPSCIGT
jgi:hypothetical protein